MQNNLRDFIKMDIQNIFKSIAIFKNIENYEITCDQNPINGEGYTGHFYMGRLKNKETGAIFEVAIKRTRFESGVESIYKNENFFYSVIYPILDEVQQERSVLRPFDNVPFYFGGSLQQGQEYVAMSNLKACGYTLYNKANYLDKKHLDCIFKIYGKFHALCFMFKKTNPEKHNEVINNLINVFNSNEIENLSRPIKKSFSGALSALDQNIEQEVHDKTGDVLKNIVDIFAISAKYNGKYSCITHGDCWSNNMLFKYDDSGNIENMKLVDFQLCRETTPIHDLSYLFYSGASPEDFDNLYGYLEVYHKSFSDFLEEMGETSEEIFPIDILKNEWMENALWGILMSIYLWEIKLSPKDQISELLSDSDMPVIERTRKWETIGKMVQKSNCFKEKTTPILLYAVNNKIF